MAAIHENFFTADNGILFHEISVFFTVKPNESLMNVKDGTLTDHGPNGEYLKWIDLDNCEDITVYPEFFKTTDLCSINEVKYFVTRES